ncbi:MAG: hypothetical protein V4549_09520 [Bacteroidota bacterium]
MSKDEKLKLVFNEEAERNLNIFLIAPCGFYDKEDRKKYSSSLLKIAKVIDDLEDNSFEKIAELIANLNCFPMEKFKILFKSIIDEHKKTL